MSAGDREELERLARSGVGPHRRVVTAKTLLALADGASVRATAKALGSHEDTVQRWPPAAGVGKDTVAKRAAMFSFGSGPVRRLTSRLGPPLDDAGWLRSPHAMDDK